MAERDGSSLDVSAGRVRIAQQRLLRDYPLHARIVGSWKVHATHAIDTAAVTVRQNAVALLYNPEFVETCSLPELQGVLHHEVNHVLFGHIFEDPARFPDRQARVIAEEVTVNEWVPGPLPGCPITLALFPQLPPDEDTDTRYRRLAQKDGRSGEKRAGGVPKPAEPGPKNGSPGQKTQGAGQEMDGEVRSLDDHEVWAEARAAGALGRLIVRAAVRGALGDLPPAELKKVPPALRAAADRLCQGSQPRSLVEHVLPSPRIGRVDWVRALRRYVRQAVARHPAFQRPPRRFPELAGIVPGQACRPQKARLMAVVDTSGSIDAAALECIGAELVRLGQTHEVTVVECDAAVRRTYPLQGPLRTAHGRGGTDLRPPLEADVLRRLRPDVVVYFTDGDGPAPEVPPPVPVIWCLTGDGSRPVPWGREVRME